MRKYIISASLVILCITSCALFNAKTDNSIQYYTKDAMSVIKLFPKTTQEINNRLNHAIENAKKGLAILVAMPTKERSFDNTMYVLDDIVARLSMVGGMLTTIELAYPDGDLQDAARKAKLSLSSFMLDAISQNIELYKAIKGYVEGNAKQENLGKSELYALQETMESFKRNGLHLPQETQDEIKKIKQEITALSQEFQKNINEDASNIEVTKEGLGGLGEDFIDALKQTDDGKYILGVDYPTFFTVIKHASVQDTRKRLLQAFKNRAYPNNINILKKIIQKRDKLAKLLGFKSYAHLDIDDGMAKTPEQVEQFLKNLIEKVKIKGEKEFAILTKELPDSVTLSSEGKWYPWDAAYITNWYKKKHFDIDDRKVAEYFPMKKTVDSLLHIYEAFFNIEMKEVPVSGVWHTDVTMIEVKKKGEDAILGYLLLDLYPRKNKYTHACEISVISSQIKQGGSHQPAVAVVLANFTKPTKDKPSLLKHEQVKTFFHEFGHAIHDILGATSLASSSGTNVKRDFVELPSQMLEEWLYDKDVLSMVSEHYKTGKPLPNDLIDKMIQLKTLTSAGFVLTQAYYALLSLNYFKQGENVDTDAVSKQLYNLVLTYAVFDPTTHFQASFGHLTGYGSKYYGYLWSKVYALDLFGHIKQHGLLNPKIGQQYAQKVLGKGGSADPQELLIDFLGRKPNQEAFLKDLGL